MAARGLSGVAASGSLVVRPQGDEPLENFVHPGLMFWNIVRTVFKDMN